MTKKDYELIARVFNSQLFAHQMDEVKTKALNDLAVLLAYELAVNGDDPKFDQLMFLRACQIGTPSYDGGKAIQERDEYMMS